MTDDNTKADPIDEMRRPYEAATKDEWEFADTYDGYTAVHTGKTNVCLLVHSRDAAFIVAAHNHLPALLATLREMREALDVIATYEDGYLISASAKQREVARAALTRARERLGAK